MTDPRPIGTEGPTPEPPPVPHACPCGSRFVRVIEEYAFSRGKAADPTFTVQCCKCTRGSDVTPQWTRNGAVRLWNRNSEEIRRHG